MSRSAKEDYQLHVKAENHAHAKHGPIAKDPDEDDLTARHETFTNALETLRAGGELAPAAAPEPKAKAKK